MADAEKGALETEDGGALAHEIVDMLESELVRFRHRVRCDHGIELDRARAALVLLGKLVAAGVPWVAKQDSDPARVNEAFTSMLEKHPKLAPVLKREVAGFFAATADVTVVEDPAMTPAVLLRRAGSDPSLWWWAADHPEHAQCWAACGAEADKLLQVALAYGVTTDIVARALANSLGMIATRFKTRFTAHRNDLVAALLKISSKGAAALTDPTLVGMITKLAFEMTAAQQTWWKDKRATPDALADFAILTFQVVETVHAATEHGPDLERFAALATRADKMFSSRGAQLGGMLRKDLRCAGRRGDRGAGVRVTGRRRVDRARRRRRRPRRRCGAGCSTDHRGARAGHGSCGA